MMRKLKSMRKELLVTILAIVAYLFAGFAFVPILRVFCESQNIVAYGAFSLGAMVAIKVAGAAYDKWFEEEATIGRLPFSLKAAVFGTVASFAVAHIISGTRAIVECFIQNDFIVAGNVGTGFTDWNSAEVLILVLATGLFGPMAEELIFRGMLLNSLWKAFGLHKAVVISSLCFGILHGNSVMTITSAIFMGIALAYTYAINRNLLDSIVVHLVYNTFVTYVAVHSEVPEGRSAQVISEVLPSALPLIFISVISIMVLTWLYRKAIERGRICTRF